MGFAEHIFFKKYWGVLSFVNNIIIKEEIGIFSPSILMVLIENLQATSRIRFLSGTNIWLLQNYFPSDMLKIFVFETICIMDEE